MSIPTKDLRSGSTSATVACRQHIGYQPGGERVSVTKALSALVGKSESWCHDRLYKHPRLAELTVATIRAYRVASDFKGLAGFAALLRDALNDVPASRLTPDLILAEQHADGAEDEAESAFLLHPCPATARAYVSKLDAELAKSGALRAAVVERWLR